MTPWLVALAYFAFGALTALAVFALESLPDFPRHDNRLTDSTRGVLVVLLLWPLLLVLTTLAMFAGDLSERRP